MNRREFITAAGAGAVALWLGGRAPAAENSGRLPHIVYVLTDDMGYGNITCLNPDSKIHTPHADRLASRGVIFTDAHSGSSICAPTRYGIMTGRHSWRTKEQDSGRVYSPPAIPPERLTVASLLKNSGYRTVGIGKWHVGMTFGTTDGEPAGIENIDYNAPVRGGPSDLGFDYFFGIPASLDMAPYFYIENDRIVQPATERTEGDTGRNLRRAGPIAPDFVFEEVMPKCAQKAVDCIDSHQAEHGSQPLFLYVALTAPHTPVVPTEQFQGSSILGDYGDFCVQIDAVLGDIMTALERNGMTDDTLLIFTSDNGIAPAVRPQEFEQMGHKGSHIFRGMKQDIFEGGHRVPFIASWPGKIEPGSTCGDIVCLTDLMATLAEITGQTLPPNAGEDSTSMLCSLLGRENRGDRPAIAHESVNGTLSIRQGRWKLIFAADSGGRSEPTQQQAREMNLPRAQLYDMIEDVGETRNLEAEHPEIVERLTKLMQEHIDNGRSTPGPPQQNDGPVRLWRNAAAN